MFAAESHARGPDRAAAAEMKDRRNPKPQRPASGAEEIIAGAKLCSGLERSDGNRGKEIPRRGPVVVEPLASGAEGSLQEVLRYAQDFGRRLSSSAMLGVTPSNASSLQRSDRN